MSLNREDEIFMGIDCTFIGKLPFSTVSSHLYSHKNNKNQAVEYREYGLSNIFYDIRALSVARIHGTL